MALESTSIQTPTHTITPSPSPPTPLTTSSHLYHGGALSSSHLCLLSRTNALTPAECFVASRVNPPNRIAPSTHDIPPHTIPIIAITHTPPPIITCLHTPSHSSFTSFQPLLPSVLPSLPPSLTLSFTPHLSTSILHPQRVPTTCPNSPPPCASNGGGAVTNCDSRFSNPQPPFSLSRHDPSSQLLRPRLPHLILERWDKDASLWCTEIADYEKLTLAP